MHNVSVNLLMLKRIAPEKRINHNEITLNPSLSKPIIYSLTYQIIEKKDSTSNAKCKCTMVLSKLKPFKFRMLIPTLILHIFKMNMSFGRIKIESILPSG